ncbi:methyl-accepting chemotaxis protein [Thalassotalea agariperforans]
MQLKSLSMNLTSKERRWLPWFGANGKFSLAWSCFVNRSRYHSVEQTFEGIAATRIKLLQQWTENHWDHLSALANILLNNQFNHCDVFLKNKLNDAPDFSELFILNTHGLVTHSTATRSIGKQSPHTRAREQASNGRFLHGPYVDPDTLTIGASTSKFHDEVTLMFYLPLFNGDELQGYLCGRVPNDVLGDLIQREAGHIYQESGDNYLFMVDSKFDPSIQPGIALSRSRFEDNTFSHGENLKSGVSTDYGEVKIKKHTEFEIRFTDPATGELHPGVRETIKHGHNLFVTYPGYSDYRHIPVIGKGTTFSLPGSLDKWGMMCEGDLEEVYRRRSINLSLVKIYLIFVTGLLATNNALSYFTDLSPIVVSSISAFLVFLSCFAFSALGTNKVSKRLNKMTSVIRTIAEGEGNLTQRLDPSTIKHDETGDMSRWVNSFIDNLDGIVGQVIHASHNVKGTNEVMLQRNEEAHASSSQVHDAMKVMNGLIEQQREVILHAADTAEEMKTSMAVVVEKAKDNFENAKAGTQAIRDVVEKTANSVKSIDMRMSDIGTIVNVITDITRQTNLLALNAAIEAARAGEHGRGFSVVADEVRGLASRTSDAANDIQTMIQSLQDETQQAVSFMEHSVSDVDESLKLTQAVSSENNELHNIVDKMFEVIGVIEQNSAKNGETAHEVMEVTYRMANSIQELAQSSNQVDITASKLQQLVGTFEVSNKALIKA